MIAPSVHARAPRRAGHAWAEGARSPKLAFLAARVARDARHKPPAYKAFLEANRPGSPFWPLGPKSARFQRTGRGAAAGKNEGRRLSAVWAVRGRSRNCAGCGRRCVLGRFAPRAGGRRWRGSMLPRCRVVFPDGDCFVAAGDAAAVAGDDVAGNSGRQAGRRRGLGSASSSTPDLPGWTVSRMK